MGGTSEARLAAALQHDAPGPAVAQRYVATPLLVNGLKFDLRVYCLVASVDPLRVFLYREGLVRFATARYAAPSAANVACSFMHLTNYAINKHNAACAAPA
jgi:tubulin polyglutamylase TTLL6/13